MGVKPMDTIVGMATSCQIKDTAYIFKN